MRRAYGCLALMLGSAAIAQRPADPLESLLLSEETARAARLLGSTELKQRAWGAYLAGQLRLPLGDLLAEEVRLAAAVEPQGGGGEGAAYVLVLLDALIQSRTLVPPDVLALLGDKWRSEALILLSQREGAEELLQHLRGCDLDDTEWLAVHNLLLKRNPGALVKAILKEVRITHTIVVLSESGGPEFGGGFGGGYVACGTRQLAPGFPPAGVYDLKTNPAPGSVVLAEGPRPVYYGRTVIPTGKQIGRCTSRDKSDRQRYLLEYLALLGQVPFPELDRMIRASTHLTWRDSENLLREAGSLVKEQAQLVAEFVAKLRKMSQLDDGSALPLEIAVEMVDRRHGARQPPLPSLSTVSVPALPN